MANNKLLQYLICSIIVHILIIALVVMVKKKDVKIKAKAEVLKSYLIVAPAKKKATKPPQPTEQEQPAPATESNELNEPKQKLKPEQPTQHVIEQNQPQIASAPSAKPQQKQPESITSSEVKVKNNAAKSPYASAQNYLDRLNQQQIGELSKQGFSALTSTKPLNPNKAPKTTQQIIDERSEAFAGKGSGIKVVGQFANGDEMIRLHGNCVRITDDPITGGQSWQASNACGKRDEFNGQLQKSLNKYLKK